MLAQPDPMQSDDKLGSAVPAPYSVPMHCVGLYHAPAIRSLQLLVADATVTGDATRLRAFGLRYHLARGQREDAERTDLDPHAFQGALDALRRLETTRYAHLPDFARLFQLVRTSSARPRPVSARALRRFLSCTGHIVGTLRQIESVSVDLADLVLTPVRDAALALEALDSADMTERLHQKGDVAPSADNALVDWCMDQGAGATCGLSDLYAGHVFGGHELFPRAPGVSPEAWERFLGKLTQKAAPEWVDGEDLARAARDVAFVRGEHRRLAKPPVGYIPAKDIPDAFIRLENGLKLAAERGLVVVEWVCVFSC
jgi:hypothetical protein